MMWGAIGWGYKSKLVFMEKLPDCKEINSKTYAQQVLLDVAIPFLESLEEGIENTVFIKDGAKVHQEYTKKI